MEVDDDTGQASGEQTEENDEEDETSLPKGEDMSEPEDAGMIEDEDRKKGTFKDRVLLYIFIASMHICPLRYVFS